MTTEPSVLVDLNIHKAEPPLHHGDVSTALCRHCDDAIRRVPGGHGPCWVHSDGYVVGHGAPRPATRLILDLSTSHLPEQYGTNLNGAPGVIAHPTGYGDFMWVPDDPDVSNEGGADDVPEEILAVQRFARAHNCDYVLFDADAPIDPRLPTWDW